MELYGVMPIVGPLTNERKSMLLNAQVSGMVFIEADPFSKGSGDTYTYCDEMFPERKLISSIKHDVASINWANRFTNSVATGNTVHWEWGPSSIKDGAIIDAITEHGICPVLTAKCAWNDICSGGPIMRCARIHKVPFVICYNFYSIWGYLYGDEALPDRMMLHSPPLSRTANREQGRRVREWIKMGPPFLCGGGYDRGLEAGTPSYADIYGVHGLIVKVPFTMPDRYKGLFNA